MSALPRRISAERDRQGLAGTATAPDRRPPAAPVRRPPPADGQPVPVPAAALPRPAAPSSDRWRLAASIGLATLSYVAVLHLAVTLGVMR